IPRPESQEIVHNGKHLYRIIRRGKHYILEEAPTSETALAIQSHPRKHPLQSYDPKKSTVTAQICEKRLGYPGKLAIEKLQRASRNIVIDGKIQTKIEVSHLVKVTKHSSRFNPRAFNTAISEGQYGSHIPHESLQR